MFETTIFIFSFIYRPFSFLAFYHSSEIVILIAFTLAFTLWWYVCGLSSGAWSRCKGWRRCAQVVVICTPDAFHGWRSWRVRVVPALSVGAGGLPAVLCVRGERALLGLVPSERIAHAQRALEMALCAFRFRTTRLVRWHVGRASCPVILCHIAFCSDGYRVMSCCVVPLLHYTREPRVQSVPVPILHVLLDACRRCLPRPGPLRSTPSAYRTILALPRCLFRASASVSLSRPKRWGNLKGLLPLCSSIVLLLLKACLTLCGIHAS